MEKNQFSISAVIVTYNGMRRNWIEKCLGSLQGSSVLVDIIVIDNGSTDGSVEFIKQHYSSLDLVIASENLGFGKANNLGIRKALEKGADFVFLLNQDAWVDVNTIEELVKQQQLHPEYGILSPIHCNGNGDALDYRFSEYISPQKGCKLLSDLLVVDRQTSGIYDVGFVNAAAWLISKECLRKAGGFSPMFYHYGEDVNYCHRVQYHEFKIGIHPRVKIYHDRLETTSSKFFSPDETKKRVLFVKMLNPNSPLSYRKASKAIRRELFKCLINLDFKAAWRFLMVKNEILAMKNTIENHLNEVISGKSFLYIND
ncbi:Glycosyltransferase, GT2 family [Parapedobacter luteus]|uniref:Glycosyltransferase, GT2 family n=1 Tax=Parapedobacter luteus TaxID=623280 RepID=A0A1T5DGK5_9SPHI|nr:glycosyltransferase family 2 protein [Parapedobacter luteus]SKB70603.1 Glycosyltransferase, GT2 family [Parapedobacter luteus]